MTLSYLPLLAGAQLASAQTIGPVEPDVFDGDVADLPTVTGSTGGAQPEGRPGLEPSQPADGEGSARTPGDRADTDASAPLASFEGMQMTGGAPPDPTGEIGPNHFVEAINSTPITIYDRGGATVAGPFQLSTLFTGGLCGTRDDGDPIVMYDQLNNRWLLAQFAVPNPYAMCIAVSQTGDPTGSYFAYEFPMAAFPDYEKFGIWRDALYMTTFEGATNGAFAFDYAAMLAGNPAAVIKRSAPSPDQTRGTRLLPADIDGEALNPAGAPNVMVHTVDGQLTSAGGDVDRIEVFEFTANFANPAASTLTEVAELPTAPFDNSMCYGTSAFPHRNCIPQLGSANGLDPLSHRPMWRASYRNFGSHESIVFNQTVDATGTDIAGIRWYEMRKSGGGPWTIFQQGTFSPDSTHRWMGSAAINRDSEIGIGYSVSSSSIFPGLRYTGRTAGDPLGELGPEQVLVNGGEAENTGFNRWGDYSHMSIDPLDDCTMWYVGEYGNRRSHIGAFQVSQCIPETTLAGPTGLSNNPNATYTVGSDERGATVQCSVDGGAFTPCGPSFAQTFADGTHTVQARATGVWGGTDATPASATIDVDTKAPQAKVKKKAKLKNNKLAVTVKCQDEEDCEGRLDVKKDKKAKSLSVGDGAKETIKIKVKPSVEEGDRLKATLTLTDAAGNTARIKKTLTVK